MMGTYQIDIEDDILTLRTTSFRAEKGSVLHGGIYNRELASTFVAASIAMAVLASLAMTAELQVLHYVIVTLIFAIVFPMCRAYVFREPCLETRLDKGSNIVSIALKRPLGGRKIEMPFGSLKDIRINHVKIEPQNPDGIEVVERVALQHGTVIPGFGEVKNFYNVELLFDGEGKNVIFTTAIKQEAESVVERLKGYIGFSLVHKGDKVSLVRSPFGEIPTGGRRVDKVPPALRIVYDEQWITTSREIGVCKAAIRNYEKILRRMEEKYGMKTSDLVERFERDKTVDNPEFNKWYDTHLALERCRIRKKELEAFLE